MTLQDEATATGDTTTRHDFLPLFPSASYGHGVDDEGDGATDVLGDKIFSPKTSTSLPLP